MGFGLGKRRQAGRTPKRFREERRRWKGAAACAVRGACSRFRCSAVAIGLFSNRGFVEARFTSARAKGARQNSSSIKPQRTQRSETERKKRTRNVSCGRHRPEIKSC